MTAFWPSIEDQLAELNDRAGRELERMTPPPDGLPPTGSWIRAMRVDDDARGTPATPWHYVAGWDGPIGCLSTRCRRRTGGTLSDALEHYLGTPPRWWSRSRGRARLLVEPERPSQDACRQCDIGLARDADRLAAADRAAELERLVEVLPNIRALAADQAIDDAERGRRLRGLWPE